MSHSGRHFEELTNKETAAVLGVQQAAASNRFARALGRLKVIMSTVPGLDENKVLFLKICFKCHSI